jgi:hypothetical protein
LQPYEKRKIQKEKPVVFYHHFSAQKEKRQGSATHQEKNLKFKNS